MIKRRLVLGVISGAVLGIFCIIGASVRSGFTQEVFYLFAFWYNRVVLGMAIGLANATKNLKYALIRGAIIGGVVSFAFFSSTNFSDIVGFLAGIVYGVIIEFFLFKLSNNK